MTDNLPRGFPKPTWFQVPDDLVDIWAPHLTGAELKVILYICRRTAGFGKIVDSISYQQFLHGIVGRDGERLDSGDGISAGSLPKTLAHLEELGLIVVDRRTEIEGDRATNVYRLCWREETEVRTAPRRGVHQKLMRQETVLQETERHETDQTKLRRTTTERDLSTVDAEARRVIAAYVADYGAELHDEAPVQSSTTRAVEIFRQSGVSLEEFRDVMVAANLFTVGTAILTPCRSNSPTTPNTPGSSTSSSARFSVSNCATCRVIGCSCPRERA